MADPVPWPSGPVQRAQAHDAPEARCQACPQRVQGASEGVLSEAVIPGALDSRQPVVVSGRRPHYGKQGWGARVECCLVRAPLWPLVPPGAVESLERSGRWPMEGMVLVLEQTVPEALAVRAEEHAAQIVLQEVAMVVEPRWGRPAFPGL